MDDLDRLLGLLDQLPPTVKPHQRGLFLPPQALKIFGEVQPLSIEGLDFSSGFSPEESWLDPKATPQELDGRLDVATLMPFKEVEGGEKAGYQLQRMWRVFAPGVRGRVSKIYPEMYALAVGHWGLGDPFVRTSLFYIARLGSKYIHLGQVKPPQVTDPTRVGVFTTIQFYRRWQWRAVVTGGSGIGLSLVTTPEMSKELFRLRDLKKGGLRRPSLKNWVSAHTRRIYSVDESIQVRAHLRGHTQFGWNGYTVRLIIPPADLERAQLIGGI